MCCALHCSQKVTVLKPGTRISLSHPEHRFLLASSRVYPEPCPAAKGLRIDSTGRGTFSLYLGDLPLMWPSAGLRHLPRNAWRPGQRWAPTIVKKHNSPHGFLMQDRAWLHCLALLTPSHTQAASDTSTALDSTPRSSGKPASSISCVKIGGYTGPAEKDFCRSSVSMDSGHPSVFCFPFKQVSDFFNLILYITFTF